MTDTCGRDRDCELCANMQTCKNDCPKVYHGVRCTGKQCAGGEPVLCQYCFSCMGSEHPIDKGCARCGGSGSTCPTCHKPLEEK